MTQTLAVTVRGMTPKPWGSNEKKWRQLLADEGRRVRLVAQVPPVSLATHFRVEIIFFMSGARVEGADLDNLAKPVLDTIFRSRYPQVELSLTGSVFDVDDDRVFSLGLEKRRVSTSPEEGVDVLVSWD